MVLIPNTLELTTLWVTAPLAAEVEAAPRALRSRPTSAPIPFDADGQPRPGGAVPRERPARRRGRSAG